MEKCPPSVNPQEREVRMECSTIHICSNNLFPFQSYLCDSEFEEVFKMSREDYSALPAWKKNALKKSVGLF